MCCMPCGHLFGYKCIKEWLTGTGRKKRACPSCNKPGRVKDLRYLFGLPTHLAVSDTSEIEQLKRELSVEKTAHESTKNRLQEYKRLAKSYRDQARVSQSTKGTCVQTFGSTTGAALQTGARVDIVSVKATNGGTLALAFDATGSFLYTERSSRSEARHHVCRGEVTRPQAISRSSCLLDRNVNLVSVCEDFRRVDYRHVAVAGTDRTIRLLDHNLNMAGEILTPGLPVSCCWLSFRPNLIVCGLISGEVCTYDIRYCMGQPLYKTTVTEGWGWRVVHSLGEMEVDNSKIVVAGLPSGVYGISYDGQRPEVEDIQREGDDLLRGMNMSEGLMVLASRGDEGGEKLTVHQGVTRRNGELKMGSQIGGALEGFTYNRPLLQSGLLGGDSDGRNAMVVCTDETAGCGITTWTCRRDYESFRDLRWIRETPPAQGFAMDAACYVRRAVGMRLPQRAQLGRRFNDVRGFFACAAGDNVRLFSARRDV